MPKNGSDVNMVQADKWGCCIYSTGQALKKYLMEANMVQAGHW